MSAFNVGEVVAIFVYAVLTIFVGEHFRDQRSALFFGFMAAWVPVCLGAIIRINQLVK